MQFFSHLSRTAHCAIGTCEKQIVHNTRILEQEVVPIGVIAGTPQPDIPAEASSEIPVYDAACNKEGQAEKCEATTKQYDVIHIEQSSMITSELPCIEVEVIQFHRSYPCFR